MKNLHRKALRLEYFTVGYNVAEAVASILFGVIVSSIALVGFGLDSIIESLSGMVLIWRLSHRNLSEEEEQRIEKKAMKFVAITFFVLGTYVLFESIRTLIVHEVPQASLPRIVVAGLSMIIMPILAYQ